MIRINLLPPEIIEKRKWDRYYPYVFLSGGVMLLLVFVVWGVMQISVSSKTGELQSIQETSQATQQQADSLAVFELAQAELARRQAAADAALLGRINMGRVAEEVSLVLPDQVWVERFSCSQKDGVELQGYAPKPFSMNAAEGYKAVAMTVVRLGTLPALLDVWLNKASAMSFSAFEHSPDTTAIPTPESLATGVLSFDISADVTATVRGK